MINDRVFIYNGDIPTQDVIRIKNNCKYLAVDTETTGLNPLESELSIVQLCAVDDFFIIHIDPLIQATNLSSLLIDQDIVKVFHHAPFDLSFLMHHLSIKEPENVVCTKVAYKLIHGLDKKSSLKELLKEYLDITIEKTQRMSDWSKQNLDEAQIEYALNDVRYLINLWRHLEKDLQSKKLLDIAKKCFNYLPIQALLSNRGMKDIFRY